MVQNPPLEIFLRELHAKLIENGIAPKRAVRICNRIRSGKKQPTLLSVEDYQEAWIVSDTSSEILTTLEDGSKLAAWSIALAQAVPFDCRQDLRRSVVTLTPIPVDQQVPQGSSIPPQSQPFLDSLEHRDLLFVHSM